MVATQEEIDNIFAEEGFGALPEIPESKKPDAKGWIAEKALKFSEITADPKKLKTATIGDEDDIGIADSFVAGYQQSITGLLARQQLPSIQLPEDAPLAQRLSAGLGTIGGDLPAMTAGAIAGSPIPVVGQAAGAFALPSAMRQWLIDSYENKLTDNPKGFMEMFNASMIEGLKGAVIGASTAGAGKAVERIYGKANAGILLKSVKLGTEASTLATMSAVVEGRLPTSKEFLDATILLGGLKISTKGASSITKKLKEVYVRTGKKPSEVAVDAINDPAVKDQIFDQSFNNRIPEKYNKLNEGSKEGFSNKQLKNLPEEKIKDRIDFTGKAEKSKSTFEDFYTAVFDDVHPLKLLTEKIRKGGEKVKIEEDPYILARTSRSWTGKADHFIRYGTTNFKDGVNRGKSLEQVLKPVEKNKENFSAYITARRSIELETRNIKTGVDQKAAKEFINEKSSEFEPVFENLKVYQKDLINYVKDSGFLSKESVIFMEEANKNYVPFQKVIENKTKKVGSDIGSGSLKRIKGDKDLKIINPLETVVKNTYALIKLSEQLRVSKALADLSKTKVGGELIKEVKQSLRAIKVKSEEINKEFKDISTEGGDLTIFRPEFLRPKPGQFMTFKDGKPKLFETEPLIAEAIGNLNRKSVNQFIKLSSIPAKLTRAGVILSPDFIIKNPLIRDQWIAAIQSKNSYVPVLDTLRGLSSVLTKDKHYKTWLKSGGSAASIVALDRNYIRDSLYKIIQNEGAYSKVKNAITHPIEFLRIVTEVTDAAVRVGDFRKGIKAGKSPLQAGFESREVTVDLNRMGANASIQSLNQLSAFFNIGVLQGPDRLVRAFKDNPVKTPAMIAGLVTLPTVGLWLYHNSTPERRKEYDAASQFEKDLYWIAPTVNGVQGKIPKPFEMGIIGGTMTERFLDHIVKEDPNAFRDIGDTFGFGLEAVLPDILEPFIEASNNIKLGQGTQLVSKRFQKVLPQYSYSPYTSLTARRASVLLSPLAPEDSIVTTAQSIENFITSWTGSLGRVALQGSDAILEAAGLGDNVEKMAQGLEGIPFVKSFVVRHTAYKTKAVTDFYSSYNKMIKTTSTVQKLVLEGKSLKAIEILRERQAHALNIHKAKRAIDSMNKMINIIHFDKGMSSEEKRQAIDSLMVQIVNTADITNKQIKLIQKQFK